MHIPDPPAWAPRLKPWQLLVVEILVLVLGSALLVGVGLLLPDDWPPLAKLVVVLVPGLVPLIYLILWLKRWVAPAERADPDPRRTELWARALMGVFFTVLAVAQTGWLDALGEWGFSSIFYPICFYVMYRGVLGAADAKVNPRVARDERDDVLDRRAARIADNVMIVAVMSLILIDQFGWMELNVTASLLFIIMVKFAAREFGFLWAEWRTDG